MSSLNTFPRGALKRGDKEEVGFHNILGNIERPDAVILTREKVEASGVSRF